VLTFLVLILGPASFWAVEAFALRQFFHGKSLISQLKSVCSGREDDDYVHVSSCTANCTVSAESISRCISVSV